MEKGIKLKNKNKLHGDTWQYRRKQWENHIRNDDIRELLDAGSVEEAARKTRMR